MDMQQFLVERTYKQPELGTGQRVLYTLAHEQSLVDETVVTARACRLLSGVIEKLVQSGKLSGAELDELLTSIAS